MGPADSGAPRSSGGSPTPVAIRSLARSAPEAPRWRRRGPAALPLAQVTPPGHLGSKDPRPIVVQRRSRRSTHLGLLLGAAVCGAVAIVSARADDSAFARRVASGCEELEPCRALEAEAERRMDACAFFCGGVAAQYRQVRAQLHRSEERRAVRDHYRERERTEHQRREKARAQKLDEWQRREAVRVESAEREHRQRLELERLRQAHVDRRLLEERARRTRYFAALGPEGRANRLRRCLSGAERCDALALELVESAADEAEKRSLGDLNEGVTPPAPPPPARRREAQPETRSAEPESDGRPGETPSEAPEPGVPEARGQMLDTSQPST